MALLEEVTAVTQEDLAKWFKLQKKLAEVKSAEALLRGRIFKYYFPVPVEGSKDNKHPLNDGTGAILQATHVINRDVDVAQLEALREAAKDKANELPKFKYDELIKWKPELVKSAYNKLSDNERAVFDRVLIVKPGSPQMEIKIPKRTT